MQKIVQELGGEGLLVIVTLLLVLAYFIIVRLIIRDWIKLISRNKGRIWVVKEETLSEEVAESE